MQKRCIILILIHSLFVNGIRGSAWSISALWLFEWSGTRRNHRCQTVTGSQKSKMANATPEIHRLAACRWADITIAVDFIAVAIDTSGTVDEQVIDLVKNIGQRIADVMWRTNQGQPCSFASAYRLQFNAVTNSALWVRPGYARTVGQSLDNELNELCTVCAYLFIYLTIQVTCKRQR